MNPVPVFRSESILAKHPIFFPVDPRELAQKGRDFSVYPVELEGIPGGGAQISQILPLKRLASIPESDNLLI